MDEPQKIRFQMPSTQVSHNTDVTTYLYLPPDACPFTPTGIVIPDEIAPHFLITNIAVGLDTQQVSTGAIPASLFAASARRRELAMDLVTDTKMFKISATNISPVPQNLKIEVEGLPASELLPPDLLHVVGFGSTSVPPMSAANINVQPQFNIIPQYLHVPPHVLEHFWIHEIRLISLPDCMEAPPCCVPKHFLLKEHLELDGAIALRPGEIAPRNRFIMIGITNKDSQARNFQAAILGIKTDR